MRYSERIKNQVKIADNNKSGIVLNRIPYLFIVSPKNSAINNDITESPTKNIKPPGDDK